MDSLVVPALYLLTGVSLYAGTHRLGVCINSRHPAPHLMFGLMSFALAAYALAAVPIYQGVLIPQAIHYGKLLVTAGIVCWICLIWFVVFYAGRSTHLGATVLSCVWSVLILINLFEPNSLIYSDIRSTPLITPEGQPILIWNGIPSSWLVVLYATVFATLAYGAFIALQLYQGGATTAGLMLIPGLTLILASTVVDVFIDANVIDFIYLSPFGLLALVITMGLYLSFGRWAERPAPAARPTTHTVVEPAQTAYKFESTPTPTPQHLDSIPGHELEQALRQHNKTDEPTPDSVTTLQTDEAKPDEPASPIPRSKDQSSLRNTGTDINLLIRHSAPHIRSMLDDVGGRLNLDLEPGLPKLGIDPTSVQQILMSLTRNAVESIDRSGGASDWDISIQSRQHNNHYIELCVSDKGVETEANDLEIESIMQSLQHSGRASAAARLLIAERIVYGYRGRIWFTANKPVGSAYHVTLPCIKAQAKN